jgi:hypothetical protein
MGALSKLASKIRAYHGSPHDFDESASPAAGNAGAPSDMPAAPHEAPLDVAAGDAEQFFEPPVARARVVERLGPVDVEVRGDVLAVVCGLLKDDQVLKPVVGPIPVDVVNMLIRGESPAEVSLHKPAMLVDLLPARADDTVTSGVEAVRFLSLDVAWTAAKDALTTRLGRIALELFAARGACQDYLHA